MDRGLAKGSFALSMAWIQNAAGTDYEGHMVMKETLSGKDGFGERKALRDLLRSKCLDSGYEEVKEILELESLARDGVTAEPHEIECPSYARRALRAVE